MNSIKTQAVIGSIRSKVDRSIGLNISTPELTPEETTLFLQLQGLNVTLTITPEDDQVPMYKVEKELNQKSPSQRLRVVLYIYWKQLGKKESFEDFYNKFIEDFINKVKALLDING